MTKQKTIELINLLKSLDYQDSEFVESLTNYLQLEKEQQRQFISFMEILLKNIK